MVRFDPHVWNRIVSRQGRRLADVLLVSTACLVACWPVPAAGQQDAIHYFQSAELPPGVVAQGQLLRGGLLPGYMQPVEIVAPEKVKVSLHVGGQFDEPRAGPVRVGMLVGPVYPLKVTNIPFREGMEVYPTIEVINRLYPPPGQALNFPIPVHLTLEELEFALDGRYVTRVIYLEDADTALPERDDLQHQRYFEVPPGQDPLRVADRLGRPMAILRMGSRIPEPDEFSRHGCPPLVEYGDVPAAEPIGPDAAGVGDRRAAVERQGGDIPRLALPPASGPDASSASGPQER